MRSRVIGSSSNQLKNLKINLLCLIIMIVSMLLLSQRTFASEIPVGADGYLKVIVKLDIPGIKELTQASTSYEAITPGKIFPQAGINADETLAQSIEAVTLTVLQSLNGLDYRVNHTYQSLPFVALSVSREAYDALVRHPNVLEIVEDKPVKLADDELDPEGFKAPLQERTAIDNPDLDRRQLTTSTSVAGADDAWAMGYTGSGWYVAILDTGIRKTHQFFTGKTIREACYSANSDCPNGSTSMTGSGAAAHYENTYEGYDHGTHVAGIAAGNYGSMSGVAKNSNIIAVQVFSRFTAGECGETPCVMSYDSDQAAGLAYIYSLRSTYNIAAVNMSLGGGSFTAYCDSEIQKSAIDNLKSAGIATCIATGNEGYCGAIGSPACISSAVAVGSTTKSDQESNFNNWHKTLTELFAPGSSINSSTGASDSSYENWNGTSMATPHVTGAWAVIKQAKSSASVDAVFNALRDTGTSISSACGDGSAPRININLAITQLLSGTTSITVTSPNGGENWTTGSSRTITWTSSGTVGNVKIEYTTNNGSSWTSITSSTPNDGSHSWTVPSTTSTQCKVRISEASDGSPSDTSNAVFSIISSTTPTITVTTPNGGETWAIGTAYNIKWSSTGSVGAVKIESSANNGVGWKDIIASTENDGTYSWTPATASTNYKVRISEASDGSPTDSSDAVFTVVQASTPTITVTSPNGGESWDVGSAHNITWSYTGTVGAVKIEYSTNNGTSWSTVTESTANDGTHSWTIPNTASTSCKVRISEASDGSPTDMSNAVFTIKTATPPKISLNHTRLNFTGIRGGVSTAGQTLNIDNTGAGTLNWTASTGESWLQLSPASGTGAGRVSVSVNTAGLGVGSYSGQITVSDAGASNSPQTVTVYLTIQNTSQVPFGEFATPIEGSTVQSSIAVTGWVLDDIDVAGVQIYYGNLYIGDAVFVEGARPDVEAAYPDYPRNYRAGWGYMMLTYFLPGGGNGWYDIKAVAIDIEGKQYTLGTKNIYCNNAGVVKPFGAIDTPAQGGSASGSSFLNWGWVLTPQPDSIPTNGSTIGVYVNGVKLGTPSYNLYREDIATLFPGYANSNGAVGIYTLDTTKYSNGVHNIYWVATDSGGDTDGIGSRFFSIFNSGADLQPVNIDTTEIPASAFSISDTSADKGYAEGHSVGILKGYKDEPFREIAPGPDRVYRIDSQEMERIVIRLTQGKTLPMSPVEMGENSDPKSCKPDEFRGHYQGYMRVGDTLRPLPIGSTLKQAEGIYYWQPGPGFYGNYDLVFIHTSNNQIIQVHVNIMPKQ